MMKLDVARSLTVQLLLEIPRAMHPLGVSITSRLWEAHVVELQAKLIGIPVTAPAALGRIMTAMIT